MTPEPKRTSLSVDPAVRDQINDLARKWSVSEGRPVDQNEVISILLITRKNVKLAAEEKAADKARAAKIRGARN